MKSGTSTLNPYAESYVPISKRGGPNGKNEARNVGTESKGTIEGSAIAPGLWDPTSQSLKSYNSHGYGSWHVPEDSKLKGPSGSGFQGSASYNSSENIEKAAQGEDYEMDVAYLQMTFPRIAEEFLSEIYYANQGDLDSAIDMLNHFELASDFSQKLPDTLDIGDVPEHGGAPEITSQKLKNVNDKSGASSSGLSGANAGV